VGTIGDSLNLGSSSGNYPNATGISPFIANPTRTRFWNVAAFDATSPSLSLLFGNAGRNTLRTPGRQNWDASVARNFRILEGHSLQFRFEAFNLTNHPNWNTPSANAQTAGHFRRGNQRQNDAADAGCSEVQFLNYSTIDCITAFSKSRSNCRLGLSV